MKYLVENKNKFITNMSFIAPLFFLSLLFLFFQTNYNLFYILIFFIIVHIYIFFTKKFKNYRIAFSISITVWGLIMQTLGVLGIFKDYYRSETGYYLIGFFSIFYILWIVDIIKINKLSALQSKYFSNMIRKFRKEKDGNYYIDEEQFTKSIRKYKNPNETNMKLTSFYTFVIVTIIALPIILLGKLAIAIGILSARYLPNSHFILYGSILFLGTLFFIMGVVGFLTYLKLDLSEEKDKQ